MNRINKDIVASFVFAVGCFLFFVIIVPQYQAIADVRAVIKERQSLLAERSVWDGNVKTLTAQYQSWQSDIGKLSMLLPQTKQIDQVIVSIEALAQQAGFQIKDLSVSGTGNAGVSPYQTTLIQISLGGSYSSLVNFLAEAEKNLRLYDILEISIGRDTNSTTALVFNLKINAYNIK